MRRALLAGVLAMLVGGCAASAPAPTPDRAPPAATTPAGPVPAVNPTPTPRTPGSTRPAEVDSLPSREAIEVLATLPEPLAGAPAPARTTPPPIAPPRPPPPATDSTRRPPPLEPEPMVLRDSVTTPVIAIDHGVPVPSTTRPMGDDPDAPVTLPATDVAPPVVPPPPAGPVSPPASTPPAAAIDSTWRVQVAAPAERDKAERLRAAAESVLLVPFVVEREGALHKVRSRGRMVRDAAERLRARAADSGFADAFLMRQTGPR